MKQFRKSRRRRSLCSRVIMKNFKVIVEIKGRIGLRMEVMIRSVLRKEVMILRSL